jgi:hypothetical protein
MITGSFALGLPAFHSESVECGAGLCAVFDSAVAPQDDAHVEFLQGPEFFWRNLDP